MRVMTITTPLRRTALALSLALPLSLAVTPVAAQDNSSPGSDFAEGAELLGEGMRKLFQGLIGELEPAGEAAEQGWNDLIDWLGDLSLYEAPEQLPNGDILIRRKEPLPPSTDL